MFICINKLFMNNLKFNYRYISIIKKYAKPLITSDEQLIPDLGEQKIIKIRKTSRKGTNFYEYYHDKSIEKLNMNDERFGPVLINSRSLNNENNDSLVIEGINMIRDAIKLNASLTYLYFTDRDLLKEIPFQSGFNDSHIYFVPYRSMKKFSNLKTPPGIMAVFKRPDPRQFLVDQFTNNKIPLTIILDNIRDPGNLGTIIRTAAGFNVNKILLTQGCVDLYNEKVLRSSMSSIFCTPVFAHLDWSEIRNSLHPDCVVHFADISGNEVTESFVYYEENVIDFKFNLCFALIIGGEIDGISNEAKRLSSDTNGYKLHIPIVNSVNSLNSSISAAIIMSEFQRKFLLKIYNDK